MEPTENTTDLPEVQPNATTILVVDDEEAHLASIEKILHKEGIRALTANHAKSALDLMRRHRVHVVLTDLMMPGISGIELLRAIKELSPDTEVVVMTAYGTVETAVHAMREGAYDFIEKPLKRVNVLKCLKKAAERRSLVSENRSLKQEIHRLQHRQVIGSSPAIRRVMDTATQAAPSHATVLVLGESGTGKELIARHVHERSARSNGPFIAINCSAIPETILEAELFGYERGAFTGAVVRREGRFAKASGGTLFLDEVAEISPSVQVKLLRVLQEGEFEPLGGELQRANARIVAATNRDLREEVSAGRFREDLFYRLNVIALTAPPLRSRREDVPLLVDHFLGLYCAQNHRERLNVSQEAMNALVDYDWPGNVRELENAIERAVVLCPTNTLRIEDLPEMMTRPANSTSLALTIPIGTSLDEVERRMIRETLRHTKGDKSIAAQLLGISTRTIYRKLGDDDPGL